MKKSAKIGSRRPVPNNCCYSSTTEICKRLLSLEGNFKMKSNVGSKFSAL